MKAVGIRELKNRLTHYVRLAKQGAEIVITEHGRPLLSSNASRMSAQRHRAFNWPSSVSRDDLFFQAVLQFMSSAFKSRDPRLENNC